MLSPLTLSPGCSQVCSALTSERNSCSHHIPTAPSGAGEAGEPRAGLSLIPTCSWGRQPFPAGKSWNISSLRKRFCPSPTFPPPFHLPCRWQLLPALRAAGCFSSICLCFPPLVPSPCCLLCWIMQIQTKPMLEAGGSAEPAATPAVSHRGGFVPSLSSSPCQHPKLLCGVTLSSDPKDPRTLGAPGVCSTSLLSLEKGNFPGELG